MWNRERKCQHSSLGAHYIRWKMRWIRFHLQWFCISISFQVFEPYRLSNANNKSANGSWNTQIKLAAIPSSTHSLNNTTFVWSTNIPTQKWVKWKSKFNFAYIFSTPEFNCQSKFGRSTAETYVFLQQRIAIETASKVISFFWTAFMDVLTIFTTFTCFHSEIEPKRRAVLRFVKEHFLNSNWNIFQIEWRILCSLKNTLNEVLALFPMTDSANRNNIGECSIQFQASNDLHFKLFNYEFTRYYATNVHMCDVMCIACFSEFRYNFRFSDKFTIIFQFLIAFYISINFAFMHKLASKSACIRFLNV